MGIRSSLPAAVAAIMLVAGATAAGAQPVDVRHGNQQDRIARGVQSGRLTPYEAHRLERQQHSIHRQEARMRWRNGGHLTPRDRWVLQHRENRASRHIYRAKHNGWHA